MIESVKQLWLQALRSGKYGQAQAFLKRGKTDYCCLGVLCEVYRTETGKGRWVKSDATTIGGTIPYRFQDGAKDSSIKVLPSAVKKWAGLEEANPTLRDLFDEPENGVTSAAGMNDAGHTFDDIAKAIEASL